MDYQTLPEAVAATTRSLESLNVADISAVMSAPLLSRPPFSFLHSIIISICRMPPPSSTSSTSTPPLLSLFTPSELSPPAPMNKSQKLSFLIKVLEAVSNLTGERVDIFVIPAKIVAGQDVPRTLLFVRELCKCPFLPPSRVTPVVEQVLLDGEVKLYQRSVGVRRTVVRMQAIMRGKRGRRASAASLPPAAAPSPSPSPAPAPEVDDFFGAGLLRRASSNNNMMPPPHPSSTPAALPPATNPPASSSSSPRLSTASSASGPSRPPSNPAAESVDETAMMMQTNVGPRHSPDPTAPFAPLMNLMEESVDLSSSEVMVPSKPPPSQSPPPIPVAKKRGNNHGAGPKVARPSRVMPFHTKIDPTRVNPMPSPNLTIDVAPDSDVVASGGVAISPLTPEDVPDQGSEAPPSSHADEVSRVEAQMLEAHKTLQTELARLKVAVDSEKVRQKERIRERRTSTREGSLRSPAVATSEEREAVQQEATRFLEDAKRKQQEGGEIPPGPVVFYPTAPTPAAAPSKPAPSRAAPPANDGGDALAAALASPLPHAADPEEIKKVKQNLLQIKTKYATVLKQVKQKESKLEQKEVELKKKEERMLKLAENLRRQRQTLKKEKERFSPRRSPPPRAAVPAAEPHIAAVTEEEWGGGGGYKIEKMKRVEKKPKVHTGKFKTKKEAMSQAQSILDTHPKLGALSASYNVKGGSENVLLSETAPPSSIQAQASIADEAASVFSKKMQLSPSYNEDNMQRIGELMQRELNKGLPAHAQRTFNLDPKEREREEAEKQMLEYRKMFIDNQQLSPMHGQQSLEAPTSVDSAFGMSPIRKEKPQAKGSYTEYIDDYEKNFEALMRESVEKAKEDTSSSVIVPPMDQLREKRVAKKAAQQRSSSATGDQAEGDRGSSSSRESKSAPTPENNSPREPAPKARAAKPVRGRKQKPKAATTGRRVPRQQEPESSDTPLVDAFLSIKTKNPSKRMMRRRGGKKKGTSVSPPPPVKMSETSPVLRQREEDERRAADELKKAVGKVTSLITRKRQPLFDLLQGTTSSGVSTVGNFSRDLMQQPDMFGPDTEALVKFAVDSCSVTRSGIVMIDVKQFERECRDFGRARKGLKARTQSKADENGVGASQNRDGGIRTKSKAREVYEGYTFSFQEDGEGGGGGGEGLQKQQKEWQQTYDEFGKENAPPAPQEEAGAEAEEEQQSQWWDGYLDGNDSFSADVREMQREEIAGALQAVEALGEQGKGGAGAGGKGNVAVAKVKDPWLNSFDKRMNAALAKAEGV